jgi:hypothetical protein
MGGGEPQSAMFPRRSASERVSEAVIPCCRRRSINPMIGVTETPWNRIEATTISSRRCSTSPPAPSNARGSTWCRRPGSDRRAFYRTACRANERDPGRDRSNDEYRDCRVGRRAPTQIGKQSSVVMAPPNRTGSAIISKLIGFSRSAARSASPATKSSSPDFGGPASTSRARTGWVGASADPSSGADAAGKASSWCPNRASAL